MIEYDIIYMENLIEKIEDNGGRNYDKEQVSCFIVGLSLYLRTPHELCG
jgi:hypothetical protein